MPNNMSLRGAEKKNGYSREEEYFNRINRELINERRRALDSEKEKRRKERQKSQHWMRCPKCGAQLRETNQLGISIEQCEKCLGVYLDAEEAKTLIEAKRPKTFLKRLKRLFQVPEHDVGMF